MAGFKLSVLLSLLCIADLGIWSHGGVAAQAPTCSRIECPSYQLVHSGNGYEIRRYNTVWMTTSPIQNISFVGATRTGFKQLFEYIKGKNEYQKQIKMTAPVLSEVSPSDGPFCDSSFVVSFSVPKLNQADPPPAKGLHARTWKSTYAAVRQFPGFVHDEDVGVQVAALRSSLAGTAWSDAIEKSRGKNASAYAVAQYNSPFQFENRVNEIWMTFQMKDGDM